MPPTRGTESGSSSNNIELQHYRKADQPPAHDDEDDDDDLDVLDDDPQARRPSVQDFELYTPDEEKRVIRKLDFYVVGFMSVLYLLSFLDRTSMFFCCF